MDRSYQSSGSDDYHFLTGDHLAIEIEQGEKIYRYVYDNKPKVIVEVGTGKGHSTTWLLMAMVGHKAKIHTYDTEVRNPYVWDEMGILANGNLKIYIGEFKNLRIPKKIDFVFHDSQHNYDHIVADLEILIPRMNKGGSIWIHDVKDDLSKRLEMYFNDKKWCYLNDPRGCGLAMAKIKGEQND
jgi:predicted O-methyltransferase YrrM